MNSIHDLKEYIKRNSEREERIVRGIWSVDCLYNPGNNGRTFKYKFLVVQTRGQGCAYSTKEDYDAAYLETFIGKDLLEENISDCALMIAFLDSIYTHNGQLNSTEEIFRGNSEEKLHWRSELMCREASRMLGDLKGKKVVNVGVVGDIIHSFAEKECKVCGTDYDESIIGEVLFDRAVIYSGDETLPKVAEADLAIVTGMTITTNTIDEIIYTCQKHNTKLLVFAETGSNLGGFFVQRGVDCFMGETFPFYIFNGISEIRVART